MGSMSMMTEMPEITGKFPQPIFPKSYNPVILKSVKKIFVFFIHLLFLLLFFFIWISLLIFVEEIDYNESIDSGRTILVDEQGNWYELFSGNYSITENDTLLYGDIVTFNFSGEIGDITYSDTSCEPGTTDDYGNYESGECWTTYYTHYTFGFFNQTLETSSNSLSEFYFCHRNTCEINFLVKDADGTPWVSILQASEVDS